MNTTKPLSWIPSASINPKVRGAAPYVTVDGQVLQVSYEPVDNQLKLTREQRIMFTDDNTAFFVVGGERPSPGEWFERDELQPPT